jgi:hypothetical protein
MDLSYGEKSAWISLVAMIIACVWYANSFAGPLIAGTLGFETLWGALIGLIILIVIIETVGHAMVTSHRNQSGSSPGEMTDERDAAIDARTDRWPSYILGAGCIAGIFAAAMQPPIFTAHVLLLALAAAEIAKLVMQIVYYRRGI